MFSFSKTPCCIIITDSIIINRRLYFGSYQLINIILKSDVHHMKWIYFFFLKQEMHSRKNRQVILRHIQSCRRAKRKKYKMEGPLNVEIKLEVAENVYACIIIACTLCQFCSENLSVIIPSKFFIPN